MCGIAGIITNSKNTPDGPTLEAMIEALRARGPNDTGFDFQPGAGLAQARLSIIDLETGHQPLVSDAGTVLVANGEIYNYIEIRRELADYPFKTASDSEVITALYEREGMDFISRLRGMYAFALFDPANERVILARDPFGIKPLYYANEGGAFYFASEPKGLLATKKFTARVDPVQAEIVLTRNYGFGAETIFPGISRLLPGETIVLEAGVIVSRHRAAAVPMAGPKKISLSKALAEFGAVFDDSVAVHCRADVPYGLFLSGGVDSTVILSTLARLGNTDILTFTAGFSGTEARDERPHAKRLATRFGTRHEEVDFSEADFWNLLPAIAAYMDDPVADYAVLPTWKLAATAARDLRVVLCGEGGDEIFAGYSRYRPNPLKQMVQVLGRNRTAGPGRFGLLRQPDSAWPAALTEHINRYCEDPCTGLQKHQARDMASWLPNDLLVKLDSCLMAHGLEGRTPFLDPQVGAFGFRLPDGLKIRGRTGKYLVKKWLDQQLPEAQAFARKRGFTVPVGQWIMRQSAALADLLPRQPGIAEICHPSAVRAVLGSTDKRALALAWPLLYYAVWHGVHILGLPGGNGDLFDRLSMAATEN